MTASAIQGDREKCLESGMNNYLAKPVRAQTLKALLESYLNKENDVPEIPNIQDEARKLVQQALSEADQGPAMKTALNLEEPESGKVRSRPASIRMETVQHIPQVNGAAEVNGKEVVNGDKAQPPS